MVKYKILSADVQRNTHQFLVDEVSDLDNLPKEPGSAALVANTGDYGGQSVPHFHIHVLGGEKLADFGL